MYRGNSAGVCVCWHSTCSLVWASAILLQYVAFDVNDDQVHGFNGRLVEMPSSHSALSNRRCPLLQRRAPLKRRRRPFTASTVSWRINAQVLTNAWKNCSRTRTIDTGNLTTALVGSHKFLSTTWWNDSFRNSTAYFCIWTVSWKKAFTLECYDTIFVFLDGLWVLSSAKKSDKRLLQFIFTRSLISTSWVGIAILKYRGIGIGIPTQH
jgi:hypothetical protein